MTVIFDFDYTLLDTTRFKAALERCAGTCGIAPSVFRAAYVAEVEQGTRIRDFDPERLARRLAGGMTCSAEDAARRFSEIADSSRAYLFPGAKELLERLREDNHRLILLTHGNSGWQNRKISGSGLAPYFDRIFVVEGIKELLEMPLDEGGEGLVMVNDNGKEMLAMRGRWPEAFMISVRGPKGSPDDPDIPTADTMEEIYGIISGI